MAASWPRLLGLLLLGGLAYSNVLGFELVWDDTHFLRDGGAVSRAPWSTLLTSDFWLEGERSGYYRPLVTASYAVEWRLFGPAPAGYHTMNLLYHLAASILLVWVAMRALGSAPAAWLAGLVFAVHPIHTESVAFVSGRTDVIATIFVLLAFGAHLRAEDGGTRWRVLSVSAFGLALLAKETAMALPAMILTWEMAGRSPEGRTSRPWLVWALAPFLAVAGAYLVLRHVALGAVIAQPIVWTGLLTRAGLGLEAIGRYLLLLVVPYPPNPHYVLGGWSGWAVVASAAALTGALALVVVAWPRSRLSAFAGGWILLALLPASPLNPLLPTQMAERFLYLPSAGFALLAGWAVHRSLSRTYASAGPRLAIATAAGILLATALGLGLHRNEDWRSPDSLFNRMAEASPGSWLAAANLGQLHLGRGELSPAESQFRRALALRPDYPAALIGLAVVESQRGRHGEAIRLGERALALSPADEVIDLQLGAIYGHAGEHPAAARRFAAAIDKNPRGVEARYNLALAQSLSGDEAGARETLAMADRLAQDLHHRPASRAAALGRLERGTVSGR